MTRDEIIRMAWKAFSDPSKEDAWRNGFWTVTQEELDDFAVLVAASEREACARVAEAQENRVVVSHPARIEFDPNSMMARKIAAVIRARGAQ